MPLSYGLSENPEIFMPNYTSRKRSRVSSSDSGSINGGHEPGSLNLFDKEQLAKLLIHALKELGYENSAITLQRESGGIQVESSVVQKLFNIIRTGQYQRVTLALLAQLPSKYGTLYIEGMQPPMDSDYSHEDGSMKIDNIISQGTDWQGVVVQMEQELKNFENFWQATGKTSLQSQAAVQMITIVEIMVLINREIFLELIFEQKDSPSAVLFLRNILRKYIQLWDSLLSLENDFLDEDATFTPENLLREMTTVLTSPLGSTQRSSVWRGSLEKSRETLIEEISDYINPNDLVPRGRLLTLLKQAIKYQRSQDAFSISDDNDNELNEPLNAGGEDYDLASQKKFNLLQDNTYNFQQIKFVEEKTLVQNVDEIWYLQFSPDGKYLASASSDSLTDRKIMIYDVENDFQVYKVLAGNDQCILYLSFSPDSRYIVSCPFNEMANIYDIHSKGEPTNINPATQNGIVAQVIQPVDSFQIPNSSSPASTTSGVDSTTCGGPPRIWCCDWFHTPEHRGRFIVGSPDREVAIYDMNKKSILFRLSGSALAPSNSLTVLNQPPTEQFPRVHDLKITSDDKHLILMPHQGNIDVYDLSQFPTVDMVEKNEISMDKVTITRSSRLGVQRRMTCVSLPQLQDPTNPLSSLLLVSLQSNELQLWDFKEQILLQKYFGQRQEQFIIRSCFGYGNKLIASGSEDGKVFLWDRINGNIVGVLTAHMADRPVPSGSTKKFGKNCNVVVWSPKDKPLFASGGDDGYIKIWKVVRE
ncbi:hypothetical protein ZYGR_0K00730 [Zygosaccharomyces rouxii]|uniref:Glucose-induced degradation protein 7 n=1 Tax=Zygosaccharomyces rouxii TaxID=4956 RepID=A0A1Q2ZYS5_ZYGRO|nr:hypothetical protein ZYGR_0K00730 [Zygosaccharomyces rouxii]